MQLLLTKYSIKSVSGVLVDSITPLLILLISSTKLENWSRVGSELTELLSLHNNNYDNNNSFLCLGWGSKLH